VIVVTERSDRNSLRGDAPTQLAAFAASRVVLPGEHAGLAVRGGECANLLQQGGRIAVVWDGATGDRPVGTEAAVAEYRLDEGGAWVSAEGLRRCALESPVDGCGWRTIARLEEDGASPSDVASAALRRIVPAYLAALAEHGTNVDVLQDLPSQAVRLSYRVASLLRITAPERQALLEAPSAEARILQLQGLVARETELLRRTMGSKGA
jgi:Lon protease-like protein